MIRIGTTLTFYRLDAWVLAEIVQLKTLAFCKRFLNQHNDPCGRQYDQMTQAARSITANIAEGSSRHQTSRETEMRLLDVARASAMELMGDYFTWLLSLGLKPWKKDSPEKNAVRAIWLDPANYTDDWQEEAAQHVLSQMARFEPWLGSNDEATVCRAMIVVIERLATTLERLIAHQLDDFKQEGGFAENLTKERVSTLQTKATVEGAPACPICGKPMIKRVIKRGTKQGQPFWGCSNYPTCRGTREIS